MLAFIAKAPVKFKPGEGVGLQRQWLLPAGLGGGEG
jgi:hypothetical protein